MVGNGIRTHQEVMEALRPFFDERYYCARYSDIDTSAVDPLEHYVVFGWKEGRDPCSWFSTRTYLGKYADVAEGEVNPFLHYVMLGKEQGRLCSSTRYDGRVELRVQPGSTF